MNKYSVTNEQLSFYRKHGYLLLKNIIDTQTIININRKIADFIKQSRAVKNSNEVFDLDKNHSSAQPCIRRLKDPHTLDSTFFNLSRDPRIVDRVAELLDGTVRFDHSKLNFKPANADAEIQWHQDWCFYPQTNDDMLAVGVLLEDCTLENGPLMVIPESHKGPLYNHHNCLLYTSPSPRDA